MDYAIRYEKDVAGLERNQSLTLDIVLDRALEDIDDLFTRVAMSREGGSRRKSHACLQALPSLDAQIMALKVDARRTGWPRWNGLQC
jgi:hypothetical protein